MSLQERSLDNLRKVIAASGGSWREGQATMVAAVADAIENSTRAAVNAPTGTGKALDVDTPIPTPTGWTRMGDLTPGDVVFDEAGAPCTVLAAYDVMYDRPCFEVEFSDGVTIVADAEHLWATATRALRFQQSESRRNRFPAGRARNREALRRLRSIRGEVESGRISARSRWADCYAVLGQSRLKRAIAAVPSAKGPDGTYDIVVLAEWAADEMQRTQSGALVGVPDYEVFTTQQIADTLQAEDGAKNHAVRVAGAVQTQYAGDLALDPYVLGMWLGDGSSYSCSITTADPEVIDEIVRRGLGVRPVPSRKYDYRLFVEGERQGPRSLPSVFRAAGIEMKDGCSAEKYIPMPYLRAGERARRDLLAGLLDSDGSVDSRTGRVEFYNTNKRLVDGVVELCRGLGYLPKVTARGAKLYGKPCGQVWTVGFVTADQVFYLPRKHRIHMSGAHRHNRNKTAFRYIVNATPVQSRPVRCITVDSDSHLFLAGEAFIPTHNSLGALIPAITDGRPTLIVTSSIALQDQLVDLDLPRVAAVLNPGLRYLAVKGRSNTVCPAKVDSQGMFLDERIRDWAFNPSASRERSHCPIPVTDGDWFGQMAVAEDECPGRKSCQKSAICPAEMARDEMLDADVVVCNMHLFIRMLGAEVLERFHTIIVDEAHDLLDAGCASKAVMISGRRIDRIADGLHRHVSSTHPSIEPLRKLAQTWDREIIAASGGSTVSLPDGLAGSDVLTLLVDQAVGALTLKMPAGATAPVRMLATRISRLTADLNALRDTGSWACWVDKRGLHASPLSLRSELAEQAWSERAVVLCSATLPATITRDTGLDVGVEPSEVVYASVQSPFDLLSNARFYIAGDMPDPSKERAQFEPAALERCRQLVDASQGGALVLCTSMSAVGRFAQALRSAGHDVLVQGEDDRSALIRAFKDRHDSVLVATRSYFQGVDIPGHALRLVTIDRIPFPTPDDPLSNARRDTIKKGLVRAGKSPDMQSAHWAAYRQLDVPAAGVILAQAFGRLIRCFDTATEILTDQGWKAHDEIKVGDLVYGVQPEALESSGRRGSVHPSQKGAPPLVPHRVLGVQFNEAPERVLRISGKSLDAVVTPDHRMVVQHPVRRNSGGTPGYRWKSPPHSIVAAGDLPARFSVPLAGRIVRHPSKVSKDWLRLLGLVITDGHLSKSKNLVNISQSTVKAHVVEMIDGLLHRLGLPHKRYVQPRTGTPMSVGGGPVYYRNGDQVSWVISGLGSSRIRDVLAEGQRRRYSPSRQYQNRTHIGGDGNVVDGWKSPKKEIPRWVLERCSRPQLLAFMEGLMAGDGSRQSERSGIFHTCSQVDADRFQELLALVGYRNRLTARGAMFEVQFTMTGDVHLDRSLAVSEAGHARTWCVNTELGTVVARRNGSTFIAGNSETDRGVVAMLDPRVATKWTGLLPALPIPPTLDLQATLNTLRAWVPLKAGR